MDLVLHLHPLSSYSQKVVIGLYELGVPFEARTVDLMDPAAKAAFESLWPTGKIPLLQAGGRVVPETSIMLEYVDRAVAADGGLLPSDPGTQLEARLWDRLFDLYVMTPMQLLVGDRLRPEADRDVRGVARARATLSTAYHMVDRQMANGTWAAGEQFTLADCAAAPALFFAGIVSPWPEELANLSSYFERILARPSVRRALAEARPYFDMFPFRDAMPERFLRDDPVQ